MKTFLKQNSYWVILLSLLFIGCFTSLFANIIESNQSSYTENKCCICGKPAYQYALDGENYCKKHYEEAAKWYFEN